MALDWYPAALRRPGPVGKVSGAPQAKLGAVYHSMRGSYTGSSPGLFDPAIEKSWHFSILQDGRVFQHYPATAWCWHCGDRNDPAGEISNNRDLIGIEHEGGPPGNLSEPFTAAQLDASIRLTVWLVAEGHIANLSRSGPTRGLWEHNEIVATSCPLGRIPWSEIFRRATPPPISVERDEDDMQLLQVAGQQEIWLRGGLHYQHVANMGTVAKLQYIGVKGPVQVSQGFLSMFQQVPGSFNWV